MKSKHNQHESGFAMVGVLVIFIIITVLGLSIVTLSFASVKTSTSERNNQSAFYIAEAGFTYHMERIKKEILNIYADDWVETEEHFLARLEGLQAEDVRYDDFDKINGIEHGPFAKVSITLMDGTGDQFIINSTGTIGEEERTVSNSFHVGWVEKGIYELPPLTVFTKEEITLSNGPIIGSIGTQSAGKNAVLAGSGVNKVQGGNIYVPVIGVSNENRTCETTPTPEYKAYSVKRPTNEDIVPCPTEVEEMWQMPPLPTFPTIPELEKNSPFNINLAGDNKLEIELNGNKEFNNITLTAETDLTINVGNADRIIVVNHLNLNNGHIIIKGSGKLTIYVKNKITMGSGTTINKNGVINNLNIFYKGLNKVELGGDQKIYGSLYSESADMYLTGSGGILGNVFSGGEKIEITGGANVETQLILAPKAKVKIDGGGSVYGMIMSKSFTHNSGESIIYGEPFVLDGPISPAALGIKNVGGGEAAEPSPTITITPPREKKL